MVKDLDILNRKSKELQRLVDLGLNSIKDSREVSYDKLSKRKRITKSLLFSDNEECHSLNSRLMDCKKYNQTEYSKDKKLFLGGHRTFVRNRSSDMKLNNRYINNKEVCQSLWCPNCRHHLYQSYHQKVKVRLEERLLPSEYSNQDFHHLTGVLGLCDLDEDKLNKMIKDDTNRWRRIRYRLNTQIRPKDSPFIETVYEFELVNWTFLKNSEGSDLKKKQIQQLMNHQRFGKNSLCGSKSFLFVHFHSITNLNKSQIDDIFRDEYFVGDKPLIKHNQKNSLYVQGFNPNKSLDKNIEKLCSYPFKDPHRFKHSFRGSDYLNGEYYDYNELSELIRIYQKLQKRNWKGLFRSAEHLTSKEIIEYRYHFPNDHHIYQSHLLPFGSVKQKQKDTHKNISLEYTMMVDSEGNIHTEGWNPNNFFRKGIETLLQVHHKKKIGTKKFYHPKFVEWGWLLEIYKNVYEDDPIPFTTKKVDLKLEEYFNPSLRKFRKGRKGDMFWSEVKEIFKTYSKEKLPLDVEFSIDDPLLVQRLDTLRRLDKLDRENYLNKKIKDEKKIKKKKSKEQKYYLDELIEIKRYFDTLKDEQ